MNKKERAEFDAAKKAVIVARALNWSEPVAADVPPPSSSGALTTGYLLSQSSVSLSCSSSVHHGRDRTNKTTSQGPRWLYSTKLLALRALRHEAEKRCAEELAAIDMQIQAEKDSQP